MDNRVKLGVVMTLQMYNELFRPLSDDDSDEEELIDLQMNQLRYRLNQERRVPTRIQLFVESTVMRFNETEFQMHFRLTQETFNVVLELLMPHLETISVVGRPTVDPKKQLLAIVWLLATPESYRSIGSRFDLGKSTLFACFVRVVKALNHIAPNIIQWPQGRRAEQVEQQFYGMAKMRGVLGAIDGTYIPIKAPPTNPQAYVNRKCFYGVTLQAVCDSERKFTDCYTGWPSSVSDTRIFKNSEIYRSFQRNPNNYFAPGQYIIGDKAYPVSNLLIAPFINRGNLQPYQVNFNTILAKTRQIIERAFALLFGRFRRLRYLDMNRMDLLPSTIIACCVLHNLCLTNPDNLLDMYENEGRMYVHGADDEVEERNVNENNREGLNFRDQLARALRNRQDRN